MKISKAFLAAAAVALSAAACGGSEQVVLLNGAGATFPNLIYQKWIIDYNNANAGVELNYQSIGSGGGIRQFSDGTVDFGGTDAPMKNADIDAIGGNVFHIPTVLGAVVATYNLEGVSQTLRFSPEVLSEIFLGRITNWNDARIRSINPEASLPNQEIVVVHRSDGSGTSFIFTEYLSKVSTDWEETVGTGKSVNWPVGLGGRGNEGVTATVRQTPGAIGYVEFGYAMLNQMPVAEIQNLEGVFVSPSIDAVTAAATGAMETMGPNTDFRVSLTNAAGTGTYPISSFTWLLLRKNYDDASKAEQLVEYVWWAVTDGEADAAELGYAPIPSQLTPWIRARLEQISVDGTPVWSGQ